MNCKYILVNGYTATGSSAVVDLLQEFNHMYIPPHEFRLLCDPFGIIDLDREINNSVDCLNDDIAIRNFQWLTKKYFKTAVENVRHIFLPFFTYLYTFTKYKPNNFNISFIIT